jgi:type I restriction enzyme S subunit
VPIEFYCDGPWELPEGWVWARLGDVCQINEPVSFDNLPDDLQIPFIPMTAVAEETSIVDLAKKRPVSELRKGYTRFRSGDVIFAKITPCMENGKVAALPDFPGGYAAGSTEFHVLRSPALDAHYLWYWLLRK